jgi:uncharacterized SAM-binding protein YcdF (DUF218 family)
MSAARTGEGFLKSWSCHFFCCGLSAARTAPSGITICSLPGRCTNPRQGRTTVLEERDEFLIDMPADEDERETLRPPASRIPRWLIPGGILIVLAVMAIIFLLTVGRWLVVEDPLEHSDAIVVLSGRLPERAVEASRVFQAGYAEQVWVSPPVTPVDELKTMKIAYLGEDFYNEKVLIAKGVPADDIRILEHPNANTEAEVRQVAEDLRDMNLHSVIIVTSKAHTRRVRTIWSKLVGSDPRLIVRYAQDDPFDGAHWWRHTQDGLDVVRETLGLLNAWAGFPLRPERN